MMGIRTIVDVTIQNLVGDKGGFGAGLEALIKAGVVSDKQKAFLLDAVEAGHASAHRGHNPDEKDVNTAMDIVENIVQSAFVLSGQGAQLKRKTPPRK
jgi:hypothetical protein